MFILMKMKTVMLATAFATPIFATAFAPAPHQEPGTRRVMSTSFEYRAAGDFSKAGKPVQGPVRKISLAGDLAIKKHQVTAGEYAACVEDGGCPRVAAAAGPHNVPVVGVNWHDASAYAAWITRKSGITHRLPTDEEWTLAAAEKAQDENLPVVDPADPAQAWIARYEAESARAGPAEVAPQPAGTFGTNSNGLDDFAGNVWEWTDSCFIRASLDGGKERITNTNCGVRVVQGAHRTYMTDFIRDPKSGGCAAGVPPTNLGFRLVVEGGNPLVATVLRGLARLLSLS